MTPKFNVGDPVVCTAPFPVEWGGAPGYFNRKGKVVGFGEPLSIEVDGLPDGVRLTVYHVHFEGDARHVQALEGELSFDKERLS